METGLTRCKYYFESVAAIPHPTGDPTGDYRSSLKLLAAAARDACGQATILKGRGASGVLQTDECQRPAAEWIRVDLRVDRAAVGPTDVNR